MTTRTTTGLLPIPILIGLAVLIVIVAGGAVVMSSQPQATPTPSASVASPSASPRPVPGAGFRHPILDGGPIDEALVGEWRAESGYPDLVFGAAGSEMCTEEFHTDQDCVALSDPTNTLDLNRGTYGGGIVVLRGGKLFYDEVIGSPVGMAPSNQPCLMKSIIEEITFRLEGDRLYLEPSGACWPNQNEGWWQRG